MQYYINKIRVNHDAVVLLFLFCRVFFLCVLCYITGCHKSFVEYSDLYRKTSSSECLGIIVLIAGKRRLL